MKTNFVSIWNDDSKPIANSSGEAFKIIYRKDIDVNGEPILVEDGKEDTRKIIQSYADQCSVARIVERHLAGDPVALNTNPGLNDINKPGVTDLQFMDGKTAEELDSYQNLQIYNLYNNFEAKDKISIDDFKKAVLKGDFTTLNDLTKKEEVTNE